MWSLRARVVFYGAALLAVADLGVDWYGGAHGLQVLAFVAVLASRPGSPCGAPGATQHHRYELVGRC